MLALLVRLENQYAKLRRCRQVRYVNHLHDVILYFHVHLPGYQFCGTTISSSVRCRLETTPIVIGYEPDDLDGFRVFACVSQLPSAPPFPIKLEILRSAHTVETVELSELDDSLAPHPRPFQWRLVKKMTAG